MFLQSAESRECASEGKFKINSQDLLLINKTSLDNRVSVSNVVKVTLLISEAAIRIISGLSAVAV